MMSERTRASQENGIDKPDPTKRAIGNTIPQSAYRHLRNEEGQLRDPQGEKCFEMFVDAFVNAASRYVPLPATDRADEQSSSLLTKLWHGGAGAIEDAGSQTAATLEWDELKNLWDRYVISIDAQPDNWLGWMVLQWDPPVIKEFHARVPDWRDNFRPAIPLIKENSKDQRLVKFLDPLARGLRDKLDSPNPHYLLAAREEGVTLPQYALANHFDWFVRTRSYRNQTPGICLQLHPLRDMAAVGQDDEASDFECDREYTWGTVLNAYLQEGLIDRDDTTFAEGLQRLRDNVQREYRDSIRATLDLKNVEGRRTEIDNLIIEILYRSHFLLSRRTEPKWRAILHSLLVEFPTEATRHVPILGAFVRTVVVEVVEAGGQSQAARRVEDWVSYRLNRKDLMKVFRIPGRE